MRWLSSAAPSVVTSRRGLDLGAHQVAARAVLQRLQRDGLVVHVGEHHDRQQRRGEARARQRRRAAARRSASSSSSITSTLRDSATASASGQVGAVRPARRRSSATRRAARARAAASASPPPAKSTRMCGDWLGGSAADKRPPGPRRARAAGCSRIGGRAGPLDGATCRPLRVSHAPGSPGAARCAERRPLSPDLEVEHARVEAAEGGLAGQLLADAGPGTRSW